MPTPEILHEHIDNRVEQIEKTADKLREASDAVSRAEALKRLAALEKKAPEELLERMKEVTAAQREAKKNGEPFMVAYTQEIRAEGAALGADPTEYAALRTRLELSKEALG
ncbi:hypothetical protein A2454_05605 [Candidatus Peribacteria bacterium RIFOXYC2_FULL_55_14]|nr:MAG: hypothetical protein UY87_C0021G0005 [Candidatus Peribacteria bacterium GW2011_GWC2_54_8]OGJ72039.1 MAG: hypothetical protein A2198_04155 [Candidatus Peribacteria bacterium RIFOXYA1_FULL_56_14]OGJ74050.1 MAG: hypothetical protein A2217_00180 [Candidatus Peribacteria bacterium RIFOXYA2_FULL_55_28]OGJ75481.1 MAG: hypothetical protein A2384_01140 [Candidatus Peribacteria bacterium RIFOXYB1_FULL_54_35]OGJ76343.1 MAG: hypothetical protein A2327_00730 [Candidatus Peribacteria bacterium RIFOXY